MSKAMQLVGIILLGIFTLVIINLMNDARSTSELNYYLLQEVTEASMYDAVDFSYYRETGLLKVDRDMFLESFNRRFAQSVANNRSYNIKIIDFNETPPKASIEVTASTIASVKGEVALVVNQVNGIIETIYDDVVLSVPNYKKSDAHDEQPPIIEIMGKNKVLLKDNVALDKYCLGYIKTDGKVEMNNFTCDVWKNSISGKKEYELDANYDYYKDKTGYKKAIAVYDRAGNSTINSIIYTGPSIACGIGFYEQIDNGNLQIDVSDLYNFTSYKITANGNTLKTGDFKTVKQNGNIYSASTLISHFYKDYMKSDYKTYTITVTNVNGDTGTCVLEMDKKNNAVPQVSHKVNKLDKKLTINYSDADGDLKYYAIVSEKNVKTLSDNKNAPEATSNLWKTVSNNGTTTISFEENTAYYIFVKDVYGNIGTDKFMFKPAYKYVAIGCSDGWNFNNGSCTKTTTDYNSCRVSWEEYCPQAEVNTSTCAESLKNYYRCTKAESSTIGPYMTNADCGNVCSQNGFSSSKSVPLSGSEQQAGYKTKCLCSKTTTLYNQTSTLYGYSCSVSGTYCPNNNYVKACPVSKQRRCPNNNYSTNTQTDNTKLKYGCLEDGSTPNEKTQMCEFY